MLKLERSEGLGFQKVGNLANEMTYIQNISINQQKHIGYGLCFNNASQMDKELKYMANVSLLITSATNDPTTM
jgi:hypothetical protein